MKIISQENFIKKRYNYELMSYHIISRAFPSLFTRKDTLERYLDVLLSLEDAKIYYLKNLHKKGLLYKVNTSYMNYKLTPKSIILMTLVLPSFKDNKIIMNRLQDNIYKDNMLALVLTLIGLIDTKEFSIYNTLMEYINSSHIIDNLDDSIIALSLLNFLSTKLENNNKRVDNYIEVLRYFTSSTLENVLRVIITSVKPTPNDYNGFIQFMHEIVRFYYDPIRIAYMHIVNEREFKERLEIFRRDRDINSILARDNRIEVSFKINPYIHPKFLSLPSYLQIITLKFILEPKEFMINEIKRYIWDNK